MGSQERLTLGVPWVSRSGYQLFEHPPYLLQKYIQKHTPKVLREGGGENDEPQVDLDAYRNRLRPRLPSNVSVCPVCWCGRVFDSTKGLRIHQGRMKCTSVGSDFSCGSSSSSLPQAMADRAGIKIQSPRKSRDNLGPVGNQSTRVYSEPSDSGRMERKRRVKWPSMAEDGKWNDFDEDVVLVLENTLKGSSKEKLDAIGRVDIFHR